MKKLFKIAVIFFASWNLISCIVVGGNNHSQDIKEYTLANPPLTSVKSLPKEKKTVMIMIGQAFSKVQTNDMIYQIDQGDFQYYVLHRWLTAPVTMISNILAQQLAATNAFKAVVNAPLYVGGVDYQISVELQTLEQNFSKKDAKNSIENLALQVIIIDGHTNKLIAAQTFSIAVSAAPNAVGGVKAADQGLAQLMPKIIDFIIQKIYFLNSSSLSE